MRARFARARTRATVAVAAAALVAVAVATPAAAAPGQATLQLSGPAAKALRAGGVGIAPLGAAKGGPQRIVLPVRTGLVGSTATVLRFGGGISLRNGKRQARLTDLRLTLGRRSGLAGKLGGEASGIFRVLAGGQRDLDPARGSARLSGLRLTLSRPAARAIAKELDLDQRPSGVFAVLSAVDDDLPQSGSPPTKSEQKSTGCALPSGAGPAPEDPLPVATRPAGAVDITGASLSWDVRDSFIRYVNTGEGTSVFGGAVAAAPELRSGTSLPLTYAFGFPFASGWHDPAPIPPIPPTTGGDLLRRRRPLPLQRPRNRPADQRPGDRDQRRCLAGDLRVADGEAPAERQVIVNLDLGRAASVQASGGTVTYERVPGAIPAGTATSDFRRLLRPGDRLRMLHRQLLDRLLIAAAAIAVLVRWRCLRSRPPAPTPPR